jgi:hypothetical protein
MVSEVDIANRALTWISDKRIRDFNENSDQARAVQDCYALCRDGLIGDYPWIFAMKRALLAALTEAPAWGWTTAYQVPDDSLRIWQIADWWLVPNGAPGSVPGWGWYPMSPDVGAMPAGYMPQSMMQYELEGQTIVTNTPQVPMALPVRYVARVTNSNFFPPTFVDALTAKLAAEIAPRVTGSAAASDRPLSMMAQFVTRAKRANAIIQPKMALRDGMWTMARFRG